MSARFRKAVVVGDDDDLLDDTKLESAATWAGGAFALLTGLLTFFGIKEGVLDRLLRAAPARAVFVFALLGIGVVCSLLGRAFKPTLRLQLPALIAAIFTLGAIATWLARHDANEHPDLKTLSRLALLALAVAAVATIGAKISAIAFVLVLGVAATALGLHSAATLAVSSKSVKGASQVTASYATVDGREVVEVTAKATKAEDERLVVVVFGTLGNGEVSEIARSALAPDSVGDIEETLAVPVSRSAWSAVTIAQCTAGTSNDCKPEPVVTLPGLANALVGAVVVPGSKPGTLTASVTVAGLAPTAAVNVEILRTRGRARYTARLVPDADGAASWAPTVTGTRAGDVVTVTYEICAPECGDKVEAARYVVG